MTKPANIVAIETATKRSWEEWVNYLESMDARHLSHKEIAQIVYKELEGKLENNGWWAQGVAVAYEQHIGRRAPGQKNDGTYETSLTKTLVGTLDEALEAWLRFIRGKNEFSHIAIQAQPQISKTDKWRHWRCELADGTRLSVDTYQKTPEKAMLSITHTKLKDAALAERWRDYWKIVLQEF